MQLDSTTWDPRLHVWRLYLRYREALADAPCNACLVLLMAFERGKGRHCARAYPGHIDKWNIMFIVDWV